MRADIDWHIQKVNYYSCRFCLGEVGILCNINAKKSSISKFEFMRPWHSTCPRGGRRKTHHLHNKSKKWSVACHFSKTFYPAAVKIAEKSQNACLHGTRRRNYDDCDSFHSKFVVIYIIIFPRRFLVGAVKSFGREPDQTGF